MSEDLHPMDDLFRSGLEGKEDAPSPGVWENIEARLNEKERKPAGFFGRKVAAAAVVLLGSAALFAAGYFIGGSNHHHNEMLPELKPSVPRGAGGDHTAPVFDTVTVNAVEGSQLPAGGTAEQATKQGTEGLADEKVRENLAAGDDFSRQADEHTGQSTNIARVPRRSTSTAAGTEVTSKAKNGAKSSARKTGSNDNGSPVPDQSQADPVEQAVETVETVTSGTSLGSSTIPATTPQAMPWGRVTEEIKSDRSAQQPGSTDRKSSIPVKDKRKGSLALPAFTLTPVVAWQKNSVGVRDDGSRWGEEMKAGMKRTEETPSRISAGILADVRASRNITIQTGLMLSQFDVHIDPKKVVAVKDIDGKVRYRFDCSAGTYFLNPKQGSYPRVGDTSSTRYSTNALNYINIPVNLKWHFGNSRVQFFASAGAGMNFLLKQDLNAGLNHQYQYDGGRAANLKSSFFNGMIGAGMNYSISDRFGITLNPQYQFAITPMNENMPVKSMPRSFNVQAGLQIKLK